MGALHRLDQCRDPDRFARWLFTAVRHRAFNYLEQRKLRGNLLSSQFPEEARQADPATIRLRKRLLACLEKLSEIQRQVVLLHDLEEWTHAEIAASLEISEVMSRQHLFVARRLLRQHLANDLLQETKHG